MISPDNIFAISATILGLAWIGFWIDTSSLGKKTSGVMWVLLTGMLLSNVGIAPLKSPIYEFVGSNLVPLAIPLLLFKADLRDIFRKSGKVMIAFLVAAFGTVVGVLIGFLFT